MTRYDLSSRSGFSKLSVMCLTELMTVAKGREGGLCWKEAVDMRGLDIGRGRNVSGLKVRSERSDEYARRTDNLM